jgi:predicted dehydrogenase
MASLEPIVVGSGAAGEALRQALLMYPDEVAPARRLGRGEPLPAADPERSLLVLANPHGLHTPRLLEAAELGYRYAICEKPAAVGLEQLDALQGLPVKTWICHGYRLLWGPETLRAAWTAGKLGRVMTVEGRYWQGSAARGPAAPGWKDDPALSGSFDVLLDLGSHWVDLMIYLTGVAPRTARVRRWYGNAASEHRDTHVHVTLEHGPLENGGTTSFGSVSKTVHGAGNLFEVHVLGDEASASWSFSDPDVLVWGRGGERFTQVRTERRPPARLAPFHGLGWLEGYVSLAGDLVGHVCHGRERCGPSLEEQIVVLRTLLTAAADESGS